MPNLEYREGDVRLRRNDRFGFVTQKLVKVKVGKRSKGEDNRATKLQWTDCGYYSRIKQACEGAIGDSAEGQCARELLESVRRLEKRLPKIITEWITLPAVKADAREVQG